MDNNQFLQAAAKRRSIYALGNRLNVDDEQIIATVKEAVHQAPSAFNSQPIRVAILLNDAHQKFWNQTKDILHQVMTHKEKFPQTAAKIDTFAAGHGTVLFFRDEETVQNAKEQFKSYADNFDDWTEEAVGIAVYSVWTALASLQIGASIQHYNPLVDEWVHQEFNIPKHFVLRGEMPFGSIESPAGAKEFLTDDKVFKVIN
ncbi:MAG: nitroreductase family protein [Candidatus Paralactobacillus gallistercoris]|uniref:Nitroreductase family protein n=1 Tax=Candidatus Paralactobacillus gallistercoris TaxID=2838724 RepID=A0A948TJ75_9LACO|nr:nitroreductase family protein [Candidatus Paralactobacillus gallistercoris]